MQEIERLNTGTQPVKPEPVFNNWSVVPEAWYFTVRSSELKRGQVVSFQILNQRFAIFRGEDGTVHALDAFCPHMGTDLALGKVVGNRVQCFFHQWEFDGAGECRKIPCLKSDDIHTKVRTKTYPTTEKYGLIWIYAGQDPKVPVLDVPDLEGKEIVFSLGEINREKSHFHISMINGLDPQHLKTVHRLSLDMDLQMNTDGQLLECVLEGETQTSTGADRLMRWLMGPTYSYAMKYSQASIASLTILRNVYFMKPKWAWPRLYMLYAYRPEAGRISATQPIYVTAKRNGIFGAIRARFALFMTKRLYFFLKDEDSKIYDNIRFDKKNLIGIDQPVIRYIDYVNQLTPSQWTGERGQA
jgi:phenylpropionate dioxygenase-like ring-hydroxylating dioxygenase large terminal subunit